MSIEKPMAEEADDNTEIEIEVVDDTPEEDRNRSRRPDDVEPEVPDDDEIASYSEKVQKRIKKLRYEFHEERRRKEAAQITRRLLEERNQMAERLAIRDAALVEQARVRAQVQLDRAEKEYRDAYETGDADRILSAQREIMQLTNEQREIESYQPVAPQRIEPEQVFVPQRAAVNEPDEKAKRWLKANPWFGQDEEMSGYAYGVHERLIKREGITPLTDEYYERIDAAMRRRFPENFEEEGGEEVELRPRAATPRRTPVVAPATRAVAAKPPRKLQLTPAQVSLAKRLGLTPQQYAEEVVKEMMNG